jgi:hypothetical protein
MSAWSLAWSLRQKLLAARRGVLVTLPAQSGARVYPQLDIKGASICCTERGYISTVSYGWIPHNAGFGFLDITPATLGRIYF